MMTISTWAAFTVAQALGESSDVAAVKLALRMGPDASIIHSGLWLRVAQRIQLPGETRGLLRHRSAGARSSIGSIAIGQEVAVTPHPTGHHGLHDRQWRHLSAAAHPAEARAREPGESSSAAAFHPEQELPDPLPAGAHRVISPLTAAEMRKLMEGVVLFGTGKPAHSMAIPPRARPARRKRSIVVTHRYSQTEYVASFVGFAPVNNPAIRSRSSSIRPKGDYYGAEVSAPVFHDVAQQVLEYLGVPHDRAEAPQDSGARHRGRRMRSPNRMAICTRSLMK